MVKSKYYLLYLIIVVFTSCGVKTPDNCSNEFDMRLTIENNSKDSFHVYHSAAYPDTNSYHLWTNSSSFYMYDYFLSEEKKVYPGTCTWDDYYNEYVSSDTVMFFFILDEGQSKEELKNQHTLLKRYDLTLQDLEEIDWTIIYP